MVYKEFEELYGWLKDEIFRLEDEAEDNTLNLDYDINKSCNYSDAYYELYDRIEQWSPIYEQMDQEHTHPISLQEFADRLDADIGYYKTWSNIGRVSLYLYPAGKWADYAEAYTNVLNEVNREINERRTNGLYKMADSTV